MTNQMTKTQAKEFGKKAFQNSLNRVPSQDPDFYNEFINADQPWFRNELLKSWLQGWDEQNVKTEIGTGMLAISREQGLAEYGQEKVNMVAKALIQAFPEIANNDPKQIGAMAKEIVMATLKAAAEIALN